MSASALRCAALGALAALGAGSAAAQVTVFGGGLGRDCYLAVKEGGTGFSAARDICDLALAEERMTSRDRAATHVNRGIIYMRQGQFGRAVSDYERAIDLRSDMPEAHTNLGAALFSMGRYQEALRELNRGVESEDPKARAIAHYNRGLVQERLEDVTAAYFDYKAAEELDPEFEQPKQALTRFTVQVVSDS